MPLGGKRNTSHKKQRVPFMGIADNRKTLHESFFPWEEAKTRLLNI